MFADSLDKVNVLNKHFSSVFTELNIPAEHVSQGPDDISTRFLKETSESIAPVLALIVNASLQQGKSFH